MNIYHRQMNIDDSYNMDEVNYSFDRYTDALFFNRRADRKRAGETDSAILLQIEKSTKTCKSCDKIDFQRKIYSKTWDYKVNIVM